MVLSRQQKKFIEKALVSTTLARFKSHNIYLKIKEKYALTRMS